MDANLQLAFQLGKGSDGKHWVTVTFALGMISASIALPVNDQTDGFADQFAEQVKACAAKARELDGGLTLPSKTIVGPDGRPLK